MAMNTLSTESTPREIVWKVNSQGQTNKIKSTESKKTSKKPVQVKDLIERTFKRLSMQLIERVSSLESELDQLKAENAELKSKLSVQLNKAS